MGPIVDSSIGLIGVLAAAALGVLHYCQTPRGAAADGQRVRLVASIAIVGALPILVLGLLMSRAAEMAPR
jgi:hypothetical protein